MSVKFEKETIRDTPLPGGRSGNVAQKMDQALTGGKPQAGYLAVRTIRSNFRSSALMLMGCVTGLPPAAPVEPAPHKDAHFGHPLRTTRSSSVVDRKGCDQTWSLRQLSSAEDGCLRCFHQRATWPSPDQHSAKDVRRKN